MQDSKIYEQITSPEEVYKAIYSLESYIFEKNLLKKTEYKTFMLLQDKYNEVFIKNFTRKCIKRIKTIITTDELFECSVFFRPKKYNEKKGNVEFRPLHSASLVDQVCMVVLLSALMFDDSSGKRKLSAISRLLPANFYGNIPSLKVTEVFKPWSKQYKDYSDDIIDANRRFWDNKKFKNELTLDLKRFFPSINPSFIYNFILDKWSINALDNDIECLKIILVKLLYFKMDIPPSLRKYYYPSDTEQSMFGYNIGIAQGLPQGYFFGNICMSIVASKMKKKFKGESFFYVDDSVVFANEVVNQTTIDTLECEINEEIEKYIQLSKNKYDILLNNSKDIYCLSIHSLKSEKSEFILIKPINSLLLLAAPASTFYEIIRTSQDEFEDIGLLKKAIALLNVVDELIKEKEKEKSKNDGNQAELKRLNRFRKFYRNRVNNLRSDQSLDIIMDKENISSFISEYGLGDNLGKTSFFKKLDSDVFLFEAQLKAEQLSTNRSLFNKFMKSINAFEYKCLNVSDSKNLKENLYLNKILLSIFNNSVFRNHMYETFEYSKELREIRYKKSLTNEQKVDEISKIIDDLRHKKRDDKFKTSDIFKNINKTITTYSSDRYEFVCNNSFEFLRRILNSQISGLLGVEINDSFNIYKTNQRALYYFELRILVFLRSPNFNLSDFYTVVSEISNNYNSSQYFHKVDLQLLEVLPSFKAHIKDPMQVDKLIQVHQYVNGLWKNGSKFLHFYTLHNEEHSVELIKQCIKIKNTIDYLKLKADDYYVLFLACYLHDISMALHPNLEMFLNENLDSDLLYSEWKRDIYDLLEIDYKVNSKKSNIIKLETVDKYDIKNLMLSYFMKIDEFFEQNIRDNHASQSAKFIKEQQELKFIDNSFLQLVADISVAHSYDAKNIYKVKSSAKDDLFDTKYLMIMLRLADLLDMSRERISTKFLKQNMKNMPQYSQYHWVSHMSVNHCHIESSFSPNERKVNGNISINELITVKVNLNTSQLSKANKKANCSNWYSKFVPDNKTIEICIKNNKNNEDGEDSEGSDDNECKNCSISCKWFVNKQWWLLNELYELQRYLGRNNKNIFKTLFKVELVFDNTDTLPQEYLDIILAKID